jgi:hypothetical protein
LGWKIIIHTTRARVNLVQEYLIEHKIPFDHINFNPDNVDLGCSMSKPLADVYLDDRAICFKGIWGVTLKEVINFKPWYRKE